LIESRICGPVCYSCTVDCVVDLPVVLDVSAIVLEDDPLTGHLTSCGRVGVSCFIILGLDTDVVVGGIVVCTRLDPGHEVVEGFGTLRGLRTEVKGGLVFTGRECSPLDGGGGVGGNSSNGDLHNV